MYAKSFDLKLCFSSQKFKARSFKFLYFAADIEKYRGNHSNYLGKKQWLELDVFVSGLLIGQRFSEASDIFVDELNVAGSDFCALHFQGFKDF